MSHERVGRGRGNKRRGNDDGVSTRGMSRVVAWSNGDGAASVSDFEARANWIEASVEASFQGLRVGVRRTRAHRRARARDGRSARRGAARTRRDEARARARRARPVLRSRASSRSRAWSLAGGRVARET